jgi:hypothetical protein
VQFADIGEAVDPLIRHGRLNGVGILKGCRLGSFAVSAAREHRWPPAEPPVTAMNSGSPP